MKYLPDQRVLFRVAYRRTPHAPGHVLLMTASDYFNALAADDGSEGLSRIPQNGDLGR